MVTPIYEQLSKKEVVSRNRIKVIKEKINAAYPNATPKQRAHYLARTIHTLIERSLPNYSKETKKNVRMELLKRKLSPNSLTINANDVVEASIELVTLEELNEELPLWVKSEIDVEIDILETYIANLLSEKVEKDVAVTIEVPKPTKLPIYNQTISTKAQTDENKPQINKWYLLAAIIAFIIAIPIVQTIEKPSTEIIENSQVKTVNEEPVVAEETESKVIEPNDLPSYLQYQPINEENLQAWLIERDSMLADEPYFSTIMGVADEYNIHPLLLFAITGQEQGFVAKSNKNASKIANNPFNVFHSWEDFNTDILDSSQIAARTINRLSKDRPEGVHPIKWINRQYAEDPNWWVGVNSIFKQLESDV